MLNKYNMLNKRNLFSIWNVRSKHDCEDYTKYAIELFIFYTFITFLYRNFHRIIKKGTTKINKNILVICRIDTNNSA